ncbi:MAG: porin family protein [Candidatus Thermoplasmatota archaeon]|nr:porin family protein [Candidatus Thermoplasmatota archaeon]
MKKIIIFILIMMISSSLYADFKIMGGLNLSKYKNRTGSDFQHSYKMGFLAGIGFEKKITQKILLEFDLLYFQKGSKTESNDFPYLKSEYKLNVISIPVLLRYQFLYDSSPYVLAGLELSSVISHEKKLEGQDLIDLEDTTDSTDFGYLFGCGYQIELQEDLFFFIEARYHFGDRNITKNVIGFAIRTNVILIVVGLRS